MVRKLLLVAFVFLVTTSYGQKNSISLLNNRFYCTFPDSAKNIARGTNIMSADPNENIETRVVYDIGDKRIVFFAEELLTRNVENLEIKLKKESSKDYPFTITTKDNLDSTICYRKTPLKFNEKSEAILINSIIIKNADNTLSKFSAYLNPNAFKDKTTFDKIVENVFSSFKKGKRRFDLKARIETFNILGTKNQYKIKLPENYVVTVDKKYDFEVYKVKQLPLYGDKDFADLIIYYGFYPSLMAKELSLEKFKTNDTQGEFMFQKTNWTNYNDKKRNLFVREQLFQDDDIEKRAQIHIAMISNNNKKIEELAVIIKESILKYDK
jgi:hypothetical protein